MVLQWVCKDLELEADTRNGGPSSPKKGKGMTDDVV